MATCMTKYSVHNWSFGVISTPRSIEDMSTVPTTTKEKEISSTGVEITTRDHLTSKHTKGE